MKYYFFLQLQEWQRHRWAKACHPTTAQQLTAPWVQHPWPQLLQPPNRMQCPQPWQHRHRLLSILLWLQSHCIHTHSYGSYAPSAMYTQHVHVMQREHCGDRRIFDSIAVNSNECRGERARRALHRVYI